MNSPERRMSVEAKVFALALIYYVAMIAFVTLALLHGHAILG